MNRIRREAGATSSEQMLVISVIAIASAAAGYIYVPTFQSGTNSLSQNVSSILSTHDIGGIGLAGAPNSSTGNTSGDSGSSVGSGVLPGSGTTGSGGGSGSSSSGGSTGGNNGSLANSGPGGSGSGGSGSSSGSSGTSGSSAPVTNGTGPANTSNCTTTVTAGRSTTQCTGQTTGSGGGNGGPMSQVNPADVAIIQNPNSTAAQVQAAEADILTNATHTCTEFVISQILGIPENDVIIDAITGGMTNPNTTTTTTTIPSQVIRAEEFEAFKDPMGMLGGFGSHQVTSTYVSGYSGFMSLGQMQGFLQNFGVSATISGGANIAAIQTAMANKQFVTVVIDADSGGNALANGYGHNGHTVNVTSINTDGTVTYQDANGTHTVSDGVFESALDHQGDKMLTTADANVGLYASQ